MLAATVVALAGGTVGFRLILHESWFQSLYRAVITASLTGLDTIPRNDAARALSIVMVLCGITIFGYVGAVIVESITGGVVTGALTERRRRLAIDNLRDHFIICGFGRVGQRVACDFRAETGAVGVAVRKASWRRPTRMRTTSTSRCRRAPRIPT